MSVSPEVLQRRLDRAKKKIETLEQMIEDKTRELFVANQSLESSNEFMSDVLRSMAGALIVTDPEKSIELVNTRIPALLGYDEDFLVGRPVHTVLPEAGHFRAADSEKILEEETFCVSKKGEEIPVLLTTSRIRSERQDGGYIYMAIDIRDRKAAQAKLSEAQRQLVEASRQAGMAEVAIGVLHNVGNVLNSVNVSATVVLDGLEQSKTSALCKLADLVATNESRLGDFFQNDPAGGKVPAFLKGLAQHFEKDKTRLVQETRDLIEHIDHIKAIVSSQQSIAKSGGTLELVELPEVFEAALAMYQDTCTQLGIKVVKDYQEIDALSLDRHRVMQIVVNFITNAVQALDDPNVSERVLTLVTEETPESVVLRVRDTGVGILSENLEKVFAHGFTTKPEGHGFGLHASANAATEMQGRIYAESEGSNLGATFTLTLPRQECDSAENDTSEDRLISSA